MSYTGRLRAADVPPRTFEEADAARRATDYRRSRDRFMANVLAIAARPRTRRESRAGPRRKRSAATGRPARGGTAVPARDECAKAWR